MKVGIKILFPPQTNYISALDPAGPWFDLHGGASRLQKNDAKFVDVVHSNQGPLVNVKRLFTDTGLSL